MLRQIAGRHNAGIRRASGLQKKKERREQGLFVAEGLDLLRAADEAGRVPVEVLVREDLVDSLPPRLLEGARSGLLDVGVCNADTLYYASSLGGAADVVSVFATPTWSLSDVPLAGRVSVYLHGLGDPGNVGAVMRSAVAFGAGGVMCSPGTADPFAPKTLRGGMGSQFLLPVVTDVALADLVARLDAEERRGRPVPDLVVADPRGGVDSRALGAREHGVILVLGSERGDLPAFERPVTRVAVRQPRFDSLNVAMAATVLLYELAAAVPGNGREGLLA